MAGTILASVPVNSEAGSYLTFAFPIILFCLIAGTLYMLLFARPHPRVPARRITAAAHAGSSEQRASGSAAMASGQSTSGGGSAGSVAEPGSATAAGPASAGDDGGEQATEGSTGAEDGE